MHFKHDSARIVADWKAHLVIRNAAIMSGVGLISTEHLTLKRIGNGDFSELISHIMFYMF